MNNISLGFGDNDHARFGLGRTPAKWEDGLRLNPLGQSFEHWFAEVSLDEGTVIRATFGSKPRHYTSAAPNPTVSVNISSPEGRTLHRSFSEGYGKSVSASREYCDVNISGCYLRCGRDGQYTLYYIDDRLEYTAVFTPQLPMWRPGTGHITVGSKYLGWLVSVPKASVTATMRWQGSTYVLKGSGYIDHKWGNIDSHNLADHFYLCRAETGDYTAICSDFVPSDGAATPDGGHICTMYLAKGGQIICDGSQSCTVDRSETFVHPATKRFFDSSFSFCCTGADGAQYTVSHSYERDYEFNAPSTLMTRIFRLLGRSHTQLFCRSRASILREADGQLDRINGVGTMEQTAYSPLPQAKPGELVGDEWPPKAAAAPRQDSAEADAAPEESTAE